MGTQCEGWTRTGGAFTLGPVTWKQCDAEAVVILKVKQKEVVEEQPACMACWEKAQVNGIEVLEAKPISQVDGGM